MCILSMATSGTRQEAMKDCKEQATKEFAMELPIVRQMDEIYSEVLDRTHSIPSQTFVQQANYGLAVRNYRLLHCAADDLESGYYEVTMTLLRSVDECKNLMRYFAKDENKNEAKEWWFNKGEKGETILSHGEVRKRLGISRDMYELFSDFYAHAYDFRSLLPMVLDENTEYHTYPYFIRDECYRGLGCWIAYANETIKYLQEVFKPEQIGDNAWIQKVVEVQKRALECTNKIASDLRKAAKVNDLQLANDNQSGAQV
jgi:hypothetical protein